MGTNDSKTIQGDYFDKVRDSVKFMQSASYKEMREFFLTFRKSMNYDKYFSEVEDPSPDDMHYKLLCVQVRHILRAQGVDFNVDSKAEELRDLKEKSKKILENIELLEKTIDFLKNNTNVVL